MEADELAAWRCGSAPVALKTSVPVMAAQAEDRMCDVNDGSGRAEFDLRSRTADGTKKQHHQQQQRPGHAAQDFDLSLGRLEVCSDLQQLCGIERAAAVGIRRLDRLEGGQRPLVALFGLERCDANGERLQD